MIVQDGSGRDIDDAVKLDPPALGLGLAVADAEPADEPVARVAGAVLGQRTGHDVACDPQVNLAQVRLGDQAVGAPYGALGGYPGQSDPADKIRVHSEIAHHLPVGLHLCLHHDADNGYGLWRIGCHAAQSRSGLVRVTHLLDGVQYGAQYQARQVLLDNIEWSLIASSICHWRGRDPPINIPCYLEMIYICRTQPETQKQLHSYNLKLVTVRSKMSEPPIEILSHKSITQEQTLEFKLLVRRFNGSKRKRM